MLSVVIRRELIDSDMPEPDNKTLQLLKDKANNLRILSIKSTNAAGSG